MQQELLARDVWSLFDVSWAGEQDGLPDYLERVLGLCAQWFLSTGASIFLRQEDADDYVLVTSIGLGRKVPAGAVVRPGVGIAGACIEAGKPLLVGDPNDDPLLAGRVRSKRQEISSAMVLPLLTPQGSCIGVLNLSRGPGHPPFEQHDLSVAQSIGNHVALAVANATLVAAINQAASDARAAHERVHDIVTRLGAGVLVVDAEGHVTHRNPEADVFLGAATTWQELVASSPEDVREMLSEASVLGVRHRVKWRHRATGRSWSVACEPMPDGGLVLASHETTDHDRAEHEMARLSRLAEIGQMTATIAHEIRNPLTGILSAAQFMRMNHDSVEDMCSIIEEESHKLNELCNEFLEFARPIELHTQPVQLDEVLQRIVDEYRSSAVEAGISLEFAHTVGGVCFDVDRRRIEQVVRNLVRNAFQATRAGGFVRVETLEHGLAVTDNGIGMDSETVQRLFTPFHTTKSDGTGLGLCSARKIVEAHSGKIRVESTPGIGTRFEIDLMRNKVH